MKTKLIFYSCFILLLLMFLVVGVSLITIRSTIENQYTPIHENWFQSEDYERTKRLHKFHGIGMSVHVEKGIYGSFVDKYGQEWFIRNGKKCKLWDPERR